MALTAGIVGLPNVGKSTLFNAITKAGAEMANYPFATIDPNVGMVEVPDSRLARIDEIIPAKKIVHTTFEFTDIAGIVKGASKGEGLEDIDTINMELTLADLESVNKRYARVEKVARTKDKDAVAEFAVLQKIKPVLEEGKPVRSIEFNDEEKKIVKGLFLLTSKPVLYVANIAEEDMADPEQSEYYQQVKKFAEDEGSQALAVSARTEEEIAELPDDEKQEFLEAEGVEESGLDRLIRASYKLLGLATFFTAGGKETRAWTFKRGMKAPQVAGVIHSDFERGFIRAETVSFDDLDKYGSMQAVKEAGRLRLEGKEYEVQDGDIIEFRFNV